MKTLLLIALLLTQSLTASAQVRKTHQAIGATILDVVKLNKNHSYLEKSFQNQLLSIDFTTQTISLPTTSICPPTAMCVWEGLTYLFKIEKIQNNKDLTVVYEGSQINSTPGAQTSIKITDYSKTIHPMNSLFIPTLIEFSTQSISPNSKKQTSLFSATSLETLFFAL